MCTTTLKTSRYRANLRVRHYEITLELPLTWTHQSNATLLTHTFAKGWKAWLALRSPTLQRPHMGCANVGDATPKETATTAEAYFLAANLHPVIKLVCLQLRGRKKDTQHAARCVNEAQRDKSYNTCTYICMYVGIQVCM